MKPMTIKEIADVSNVSQSTIRNWITSAKSAEISAKVAKAKETSIAATFYLDEVIAIVRAGGNDTLADLLLDNARKTAVTEASQVSQGKKNVGLPNGRQLAELQRIYPKDQLTARIDAIMGWAPVPDTLVEAVLPQKSLPAPEEPRATEAEWSQFMDDLRAKIEGEIPKARGIGRFVEKQILDAKQAKILQDKLNYKLSDDEGEALV